MVQTFINHVISIPWKKYIQILADYTEKSEEDIY